MKHILAFYMITALLLTAMSCGPTEEDKQVMVRQQYALRVQEYVVEKSLACKAEALRIAEAKADSIIKSLQINPLGDSLYKPFIPPRPNYIPVDTSVFDSKRSVKPIL